LPRRYSLGKRATQQAETRQRIIDAALALYQEQGVSATTMLDVARRADVAPGTVANHFGSAETLATEALERILADLRMPGPEIFDGVDGLADRIRLLVHEIGAFFRRSESWWYVRQREPGVQAWADAETHYNEELDGLVRATLGPLADDADAVAVVSAVLGTWVLGMVEATGRSAETAADLVADLLTAWLATRTVRGVSGAAPVKRRR
jgi:AcrR family transcriptional regulator